MIGRKDLREQQEDEEEEEEEDRLFCKRGPLYSQHFLPLTDLSRCPGRSPPSAFGLTAYSEASG